MIKERPPERPKKTVVKDTGPEILDMFATEEEVIEEEEELILNIPDNFEIVNKEEFEEEDIFESDESYESLSP